MLSAVFIVCSAVFHHYISQTLKIFDIIHFGRDVARGTLGMRVGIR